MNPTVKRWAFMLGGLVLSFVVGQAMAKAFGSSYAPAGVIFLGLVFASLNALFAVGLVLIYRASRVINFAQAGPGAVGAVLFAILGNRYGYVWGLLAGVAGSIALGVAVEVVVLRRFFKAARLILTVATLGLTTLFTYIAGGIAGPIICFLNSGNQDLCEQGLAGFNAVPVSPAARLRFNISGLPFTGDHIVAMAVSVLILGGMAAFFRFADVGIAIRGAAENDDRASLLGVNTRSLSTMVWGMAAGLSGISALLAIPFQFGGGAAGVTNAISAAGSLTILLRALAAAVLAKMEHLPTVVVASFGIAIMQQCVFWAFGDGSLMNVALVIMVLGTLLIQRSKLARTDEAAGGTWAATEEVRPVPNELADVPQVKRGIRRTGIALVAFLLVYPWVMAPSQTNLFSTYFIYGIIAISLVVLTGWGGQISLGQFAFVAMGGVIGSTLHMKLHWPFVVALILGSIAGGGLAVLLGLPALRIRGLFLGVTTLAFSVMVSTVVLNPRYFQWLLPPTGIRRPKFLFVNFENERAYYYLCLVLLAVTVVAIEGIRKSRTGRVLIAMRDNERAAQAFGVSLVKVRLATFALSGALAAFAGVLFAHHQHAVDIQSFAPERSVDMFLMAVIGGLGSVRGVLLGAAYVATVTTFLPTGVQTLATGLGVLFVLYVFPSGIGGLVYGVRDTWLRRVAGRLKIVVPSLVGDFRIGTGQFAVAPLAPKFGAGGMDEEIPVVYRLPSRIGLAGKSQDQSFWRF